MATAELPRQERLLLHDISWETYGKLLRDLEGRRHLRLTYDRGMLEIMTLSFQHEKWAQFLGRMVVTLTEELVLPIAEGGSTTFRRRRKQRGIESDNCYWIQNEHLVRAKKKIDLRKDPPPDLGIEADVSRSSLNRMAIYATLRVPEVWRYKRRKLTFHVLQNTGEYAVLEESRAFPGLRAADLAPFLSLFEKLDVNEVIRQFRAWIRQRFGTRTPQP